MHPKMIHCCEAPRCLLSNYFGKKQVLRGTFGAIWHRETQMYPQPSFELEEQSQCQWICFTIPTELKSS